MPVPGAARRCGSSAPHGHRLERCPECEGPVGLPIRTHRRIIEDLLEILPEITEHTVHGHWCRRCKRIVTPKVSAALPGATLGLRFVVYTAWLLQEPKVIQNPPFL
jgi:transposase